MGKNHIVIQNPSKENVVKSIGIGRYLLGVYNLVDNSEELKTLPCKEYKYQLKRNQKVFIAPIFEDTKSNDVDSFLQYFNNESIELIFHNDYRYLTGIRGYIEYFNIRDELSRKFGESEDLSQITNLNKDTFDYVKTIRTLLGVFQISLRERRVSIVWPIGISSVKFCGDYIFEIIKINAKKEKSMICPHCFYEFHDTLKYYWISNDSKNSWFLQKTECPRKGCNQAIFTLISTSLSNIDKAAEGICVSSSNIPRILSEHPVRLIDNTFGCDISDYPSEYSEIYLEARKILIDSPMASSALSRIGINKILQRKGGFKFDPTEDLNLTILAAINSGKLPTFIRDGLDFYLEISGMKNDHEKYKNASAIQSILPGEAEVSLEILEILINYYIIQPETVKNKIFQLKNHYNRNPS